MSQDDLILKENPEPVRVHREREDFKTISNFKENDRSATFDRNIRMLGLEIFQGINYTAPEKVEDTFGSEALQTNV